MKKMWFSIILKGFYLGLLILPTSVSFAQTHKWEFGVGLRPLTLEDEPYSLMLKRYLSKNIAVRVGGSFIYKKKEDFQTYSNKSYKDSASFRYSYGRIDKDLSATTFFGVQYGIRKNNVFWYSATDFSYQYNKSISDLIKDVGSIESGTTYTGIITMVLLPKLHIHRFGIRQSIGVQYFINSNISFSIEGSIMFEKYHLVRFTEKFFFGVVYDKQLSKDPSGLISIWGNDIDINQNADKWLNGMSLSPLSILTFFYHF